MPDTNKKVSNITFKNQFWFTFCNCFFYLILIEIYKIPYLFRRKWMQRLKCRLEICTWMTCLICFDIEISISRKKKISLLIGLSSGHVLIWPHVDEKLAESFTKNFCTEVRRHWLSPYNWRSRGFDGSRYFFATTTSESSQTVALVYM